MSFPYNGGLCFITDTTINALSHTGQAEAVIRAGCQWVQLREKHLQRDEIYRTALSLREVTKAHGVFFTVNDHADIAEAVGADGLHIGQEDLPIEAARKVVGPDMLIGVSTHDPIEAVDAEKRGADYIGFGPVFHTTTKKEAGTPRGLGLLREISESVTIPVVAIGGISVNSAGEVFNSGASAIALASAILKGEVSDITRSIMEIIGQTKNSF